MLGIPADKDGIGVIRELAPVIDWLIVTRAHNPHLQFDAQVMQAAHAQHLPVQEAAFAEQAITLADRRLNGDGTLLIIGTQSFVGDALAFLGAPTQSIWSDGGAGVSGE